jgi:hypothetical protein
MFTGFLSPDLMVTVAEPMDFKSPLGNFPCTLIVYAPGFMVKLAFPPPGSMSALCRPAGPVRVM